MIAFVIWTVVCLIFVGLGIYCLKSTTEVGFFQGVKPHKMKDVKAYNQAVAKIWFTFAVLLEILGIPLLFMEQNSPFAFLIVVFTVFLVIGIIIAYHKVEIKHRL